MAAPKLCPVCNKKIMCHSLFLYYGSCSSSIHRNCAGLSSEEYDCILSKSGWVCNHCISTALPFNHIDEDSEFLNAVYSNTLENCTVPVHRYSSHVFNPFETNEDEDNLPFGDIDPDTILYYCWKAVSLSVSL